MKNSQSIVLKMLKYKLQKKKNIRRSVALFLIIAVAIISFMITPAITLQGNMQKTFNGASNHTIMSSKNSIKANIEPSMALKGSYLRNGYVWNYASDPATSKIEADFKGIASDNGKVLADKSVLYGKDDYNAFSKYETGTFGVAISALAQQYNIYSGESEDIPVEVVFVLDTSGSMRTGNVGGITRAGAMVNAINTAIKEIMYLNKNNRVGIVNFSDGSSIFLGLDRYKTSDSNNKYLQYENEEISTTGNGVINDNGQVLSMSTKEQTDAPNSTVSNWLGTYTQSGIARANEMLQANKEITYTNSQGDTVKRKPIVILLSDGEPTYCTSNYTNVLAGPHYGNGYADSASQNNKGVHGYYTILSANHYKEEIAKHYGRNSGFYTIGMGIDANGIGNPSVDSITGDDYKRLVLNPTPENVSSLYKSLAPYNDITGKQMCELLNNTEIYDNDGCIIVNYAWVPSLGAYTSPYVPIVKNKYKDIGYYYADKTYMGDMTEDELKKAFASIIKSSIEKVEYGFELQKNTKVNIKDPIGRGMEVKGIPILRYNGTNYINTSKTENTVDTSLIKTYVYDYNVKDWNTGRTVQMNKITVKVITNNDGFETVNMEIPDKCMPVYSLNRDSGAFFEELPIRLIYKVGIKQDILTAAKTGDVFYTNRWEDESAVATLYPKENNPYYINGGIFSNTQTNKSENPTATSNTSTSYVKLDKKIRLCFNIVLKYSLKIYRWDCSPIMLNKRKL